MKATGRRPSRPISKPYQKFPALFIAVSLFVGVSRVFLLHSSLFETSSEEHDGIHRPSQRRRHRILPKLENCSAAYPVDNNIEDATTTTITSERHPCALLFFGLAKNFKDLVYPSIRDNILRANPHCDVFAHTYNISVLKSHRNQGHGNVINASEIHLLTRNVKMETIEEMKAQHNTTHLLQDRF